MITREVTINKICKLNSETIGSNNHLEFINYLDTGNITRNKVNEFKKLYKNIDKFPSRAQRKVQINTIIYSTVRPEQEHFGIIENEVENLIVSTGFTTIDVIDDTVDAKYIYYCLTNRPITEYLNVIATNNVTSYPSLNPSDIGDLVFNIPTSKKQQKKIAKVLSDLDAKIELNNKINFELEKMAKTLYNYWFVQFDFPDVNGNPYKTSGGKMVLNEIVKREIPMEWEIKSLSKITDTNNDTLNPLLFPEEDFKHYSIPTFDLTKTYGIEKGKEIKSNKFIVTERDILVSKLNPKFSRVVYTNNEDKLICSTEFVVWRTSNNYYKNYLYIIAKDLSFISYCAKSATGTSNSHKRVEPKVMMDYKIVQNNILAEKYGKTIDPWLKMIVKNQKENQELASLRDWLLPMLMNGQVSVGEVERELGMVAESGETYKKIE